MMMNRRTFSTALLTGAAASLISTRGMAANATPEKARNVVLVHGLFADGSSWSEVIPRLQAAELNVTSVQNPLTTLKRTCRGRRVRVDLTKITLNQHKHIRLPDSMSTAGGS
jgi:hypothetical protein